MIAFISGICGFIATNLAIRLLENDWIVYGCDKNWTPQSLSELSEYDNFIQYGDDICDLKSLPDCDVIFHLAAESHVHNSIIDCKEFIRSNIEGTRNLLELYRNKPDNIMPKSLFIYMSSDEVYGDIKDGCANETHPLNPTNNYSVSKCAGDMLVQSYGRTYGMNYAIVRATNNYGIFQNSEKFIPLIIKHYKSGHKIKLHNKGQPIRNWLHVEDTIDALLCIYENRRSFDQEIFNIGGNLEQTNWETCKIVLEAIDEYAKIEDHIDLSNSRPGQDYRYAVDDSKLRALGWKPTANFKQEIRDIVKWYLEDPIERLFK